LILFNFADELAVPFTAYTRYMMYPLVLMGLLLLPAATVMIRRSGPWPVVLTAIVIGALQAAPLARTLALDFRPDFARSSLEWDRIPIFMPVRELLERMAQRPDAGQVKSVRLLGPAVDPLVAPIAYPDLNRRWTIHPEEMKSLEHCACQSSTEAVLLGFELNNGVALGFPENRAVVAATDLCVARIRMTCQVIEARHDTGALVGVLGIPAPDR
jgi:hypothetical protein